jgi:hypothetical protein
VVFGNVANDIRWKIRERNMRRYIILVLTIFTLVNFLPQHSYSQTSSDFTRLITKNDQKEFDVEGATKIDPKKALELQENGAVFIDVRRTFHYDCGHIPGAIALELKQS